MFTGFLTLSQSRDESKTSFAGSFTGISKASETTNNIMPTPSTINQPTEDIQPRRRADGSISELHEGEGKGAGTPGETFSSGKTDEVFRGQPAVRTGVSKSGVRSGSDLTPILYIR